MLLIFATVYLRTANGSARPIPSSSASAATRSNWQGLWAVATLGRKPAAYGNPDRTQAYPLGTSTVTRSCTSHSIWKRQLDAPEWAAPGCVTHSPNGCACEQSRKWAFMLISSGMRAVNFRFQVDTPLEPAPLRACGFLALAGRSPGIDTVPPEPQSP